MKQFSIIILFLLVIISSCKQTNIKDDRDYKIAHEILSITGLSDSSYVVLDIKQGNFTKYMSNDTLVVGYKKIPFVEYYEINSQFEIDQNWIYDITNQEIPEHEIQGKWKYSSIANLPVFDIKNLNYKISNEYSKQIKQLGIDTLYVLDWNNMREKEINGICLFSKPTSDNSSGFIAMQILTEKYYSIRFFQYSYENETPFISEIKCLRDEILVLRTLIDNGKVENLYPLAVIVGPPC